MSNKFDRPDPGLDPEYCDALSDDPSEICAWCNAQFDDRCPEGEYYPYCSLSCSIAAERESEEDQ